MLVRDRGRRHQKLAKLTLQRGVKDKTAGPVPVVRNIKDVKKLRIVVTHDPAEFLDLGLMWIWPTLM